jgi:hypothetical protein
MLSLVAGDAKKRDRPVILFQGGIHAGEIYGKIPADVMKDRLNAIGIEKRTALPSIFRIISPRLIASTMAVNCSRIFRGKALSLIPPTEDNA